jgi:PAS domain S-box-containing protein
MNGRQLTALVALSIVIAISASYTALSLAGPLRVVVLLALTTLGLITGHWVRARLAAAEALRESEERCRSVISDIDEVIFRTDATGRWTFLNSAWTPITGFAPESSLGSLLIDAVYPDDRAAILEQWQSLMWGKSDDFRHEVRYVTKDNGARWVEVHARVTRNAHGAPMGTAGVIRDVTERRCTEDALRAAREAAEAASRAKSEFLSRMSHELRTPLNAILGFGQLMELEAATPDQQENATQILRGGRHLLALINEVLDITGIESGHLALSTEPVLVREVVEEVLDLMQPLAGVRQIELSSDPAHLFDEYVHADRQRLKQVLLNLVANAVKYNREGGKARITWEHAEAGRVRIVVADTGPGIPAEKVSRLFTAFDRLGTESTVEGTGLGLALSKRLVEAMSGAIGIETTVGTGSTFWIELPRAESQLDTLCAIAEDASASPAPNAPRKRGRILYVEDNLSNLTLMERILERHARVQLTHAMSGGHALGLARLQRPDLILLDLHLPDVSGEEVLSQLREDTVCRNIPVVMISADATPGQIDRVIAGGAYAYVTKPLDLKIFIALLDEVLDLKEAAA